MSGRKTGRILSKAKWFFYSESVSAPISARGIMQVSVTFAFLLAGLYVILSAKYDAATQRWAFGVLGLISGYWLGRS
jgi:hypothetical protein